MYLQKEEVAAAVLLLCAAVATSAFAFLAANASAPYSEDSGKGDLVRIEGTVLHKEKTYRGGHVLLTVRTGTGPVTVFVPSSCDAYDAADRASPGRLVAVQGTVQEYRGEREIVAETIELR
jgi:DNA/RNA endonuclease YhcR with UshA esterase domain